MREYKQNRTDMRKQLLPLMLSLLAVGGVTDAFAEETSSTVAGDLNGDGVVTVADYVALNKVVKSNMQTFLTMMPAYNDYYVAVTSNGKNISLLKSGTTTYTSDDVASLLESFRTPSYAYGEGSGTNDLISVTGSESSIKVGGSETITISLNNTSYSNVYSFQFDVVVPSDVAVSDIATNVNTSLTPAQLVYESNEENTIYRFVYTLTGEGTSLEMLTGSLASFTAALSSKAGSASPQTIKVQNIHLAQFDDTSGSVDTENKLMVLGSVTDIAGKDASYTITVAEPTTLQLDETSTSSLADQVGEKVDQQIDQFTIYRSFVANNWGTIVLPFNVTYAELQEALPGATVCEFVGYGISDERQNGLPVSYTFYTKKYEGELQAGTPYFIKVASAVSHDTGLTFTNKAISTATLNAVPRQFVDCTDGSDESGNITFYGTYTSQDIPGNCLFLAGNKYWFSAKNAPSHSKGYRAWISNVRVASMSDDPFTIPDNTNAAKINVVEDESTGIESVESTESKHASNRIYNVMGQYVGENIADLPAGVYIKNGKKFSIH